MTYYKVRHIDDQRCPFASKFRTHPSLQTNKPKDFKIHRLFPARQFSVLIRALNCFMLPYYEIGDAFNFWWQKREQARNRRYNYPVQLCGIAVDLRHPSQEERYGDAVPQAWRAHCPESISMYAPHPKLYVEQK